MMDYAANAGRSLEIALSVLEGKISAGDMDRPAWDIIVAKCRRLHALEVQQAQFGISTPPHITIEIEDLRREVEGTEMHLQHGSRSVWVGHA